MDQLISIRQLVTVPNQLFKGSYPLRRQAATRQPAKLLAQVGVRRRIIGHPVNRHVTGVKGLARRGCDLHPRVSLRREAVIVSRVLDQLNARVYQAFREAGIEIPYAKQDVYVRRLPKDAESVPED